MGYESERLHGEDSFAERGAAEWRIVRDMQLTSNPINVSYFSQYMIK